MKKTAVYFETGYLLDSSFERSAANKQIIDRLLPKFQEAWDAVGSKFIEATLDLVGSEFRRSELTAYLILHPEIFSCSHPFLININRFLDFDPQSREHLMKFSELVYHELLHIYIDDNFRHLIENGRGSSTVLKTLEKEDDLVLEHVHLYALQKSVFTENQWENVWDWVVENSASLHHRGYRRAIELVSEIGAEKFLKELRN